MSASRVFPLIGASIFQSRLRPRTIPTLLLSSKSPIPSLNLISSSSLRFPRYSSSSAAVVEASSTSITGDELEASVVSIDHHPWPEWVAFVSKLKSKGYFRSSTAPESADGDGDDEGVANDVNSLKTACLSFARDRFDIFKSLSKQEIQAVVDKGCPNLFRKAVNAAKRLRAYLQLNEGDVCNACELRGSCDRAFYVLKDFESAGCSTVDVVRLLLLYALDPAVTSGNVGASAKEAIEISARKLLTQLTELSETERDPDLMRPEVEVFQQKKQFMSKDAENNETKRGDWTSSKNSGRRKYGEDGPRRASGDDVEMKRGDWSCPKCNFMNFARNVRCLKCEEERPGTVSFGQKIPEKKPGDWDCPKCNFMNFARNMRCFRCQEEGPKNAAFGERKKGDWDCPKCGFMNYANNAKCKRCQDPRTQARPGDWECPECHVWNFSANSSCKKCSLERPK